MKHILILLCLFSVFTSCKKKKEEQTSILDIPLRQSLKYDFTLPALGGKDTVIPETFVPFTTPPIANTLPADFAKSGFDINKIKSVNVEGMNLTIKAPAGQTFSFLKSIKIYLGGNGLGERLIATKDNINSISPAPTLLNLDPVSSDIAPFIKGATYYLKIESVFVRSTAKDIELASEIKLLVIINPAN